MGDIDAEALDAVERHAQAWVTNWEAYSARWPGPPTTHGHTILKLVAHYRASRPSAELAALAARVAAKPPHPITEAEIAQWAARLANDSVACGESEYGAKAAAPPDDIAALLVKLREARGTGCCKMMSVAVGAIERCVCPLCIADALEASEKRRVDVEGALRWFSLETAKAAGCEGVVTGEQVIAAITSLRAGS